MDDSPCYQCNLYVANKFRQFQNGEYKNQFCIDCNPQNKYFVQNPMDLSKCAPNDLVYYDVKYGSSSCAANNGEPQKTLTYDVQGNLILRPGFVPY